MSIVVATSTVTAPIPLYIGDLADVEFNHPQTITLTDLFSILSIQDSADLQSAMDSGYVTVTFNGNSITDLSTDIPAAEESEAILVPQPKNSIEIDAEEYQLVGDQDSPGNDKVYGTNGSGTKGWYDAGAGGGGDVTSSANITDNSIVRGDGGAKGIQDSQGTGVSWTISDDGLLKGTFSRTGYGLEITNTLLTGGGNGMLICGGDQTGDIAMRICDSDNSLTLMEYEANGQGIIIGDTWANANGSPQGAFAVDVRWSGGFENADFHTLNGNYRIAGEIVPIHSYVFRAETWQSPRGTDWAVNDFASLGADSNNSGLRVRRFDDTTAEGVGQIVHVPINATNVVFRFVSRAETAPGGARTVSLNFYERGMPDNGAVDAWSSAVAFADLSMPTNENWQTDTETFTLAALGLTAGQTHQIEIVRDGAGTLSGDWTLLSLVVEFI